MNKNFKIHPTCRSPWLWLRQWLAVLTMTTKLKFRKQDAAYVGKEVGNFTADEWYPGGKLGTTDTLGVHQLAVRLEEAHLAAIFKRLDPDTFTLLGGGIEQRDVRHMDGHLFLDDATHFTLQRVRAHVLLHTIRC